MTKDKHAQLRKMPVFGGLNDHALELICQESLARSLSQGEFFFREGDDSDALFVIQHGDVSIQRDWGGEAIELSRLGSGDCFGEMSLIDLQPRSASARARSDCLVTEISRLVLFHLYKLDLQQYSIIMMNLGRELSRRLRVTGDRLFELEQRLPAEST